MTAITGLLTALTSLCGAATLPGTFDLALLTVAGLLPSRERRGSSRLTLFRLTVVIPAHDEELTIERCVRSILTADRAGVELELVVIADNCTDRTAERARAAGARVMERSYKEERGKGYALDFAFKNLSPGMSEGFAVVDADSEVAANFLTEMSAVLQAGAAAAQCRYCVRGVESSLRSRLARLASSGFNILRPRGRDRLGLSAGLYGNGFALSAETIRQVPYAARSVVEDLEYHLALVRAGRRVHFADRTAVYASIPAADSEGANTQRARWEGGRLRMLWTQAPILTREVLQGRFALIEPLLDLLLLPLAFHAVLLLLAVFSPLAPVRDGAIAGLLVIFLYLAGAIRMTGGGVGELAALAAAPFYIGWKLLLLPRLLRGARSKMAWVRTERIGVEKCR